MKKYLLFILFLFYFSTSVFGQITVSGRVIDYNGALFGATIQIKGTNKGTVANIDGNFEIVVDNLNDILVFSFEGMFSKEIEASKINGDIVLEYPLTNCPILVQQKIFKINYWNGIFYNPYGLSLNFTSYHSPRISYMYLASGYSTNFKHNYDFFGEIGTRIFSRKIYYKFQQTIFHNSKTQNEITTHLLKSESNLKFIKTNFSYGIGYQTFIKKGLENSQAKNYGIHLGSSKYLNFARLNISAKSFYWQDYWAWEADITKDFKRKIHTSISYRQTTQDFKEINLTLGYIF